MAASCTATSAYRYTNRQYAMPTASSRGSASRRPIRLRVAETPEKVGKDRDVGFEEHVVTVAAVRPDICVRRARHPSPAQHRAARGQQFLVGEEQAETTVEMARGIAT